MLTPGTEQLWPRLEVAITLGVQYLLDSCVRAYKQANWVLKLSPLSHTMLFCFFKLFLMVGKELKQEIIYY